MSDRAGQGPPGRLLSPHLVSVPADASVDPETVRSWGQVLLRVDRGSDPALLTSWQSRVLVRRVQASLAEASWREALGAGDSPPRVRVDWRVHPEDLSALPEASFGAAPPFHWVIPEGDALAVGVEAGARGYPVLLAPSRAVLRGQVDLLALLDHYLFSPDLAVPVEPFHRLLSDALAGRGGSMWGLWFGLPLAFFSVDRSGQVSLWHESETGDLPPYGTVLDGPAAWRQSPGLARLRARLRGHLPEPCAACPHRGPCGAVLRTLDRGADCVVWGEVFHRVALAAATLNPARTSSAGASSPGGSPGGPIDRR